METIKWIKIFLWISFQLIFSSFFYNLEEIWLSFKTSQWSGEIGCIYSKRRRSIFHTANNRKLFQLWIGIEYFNLLWWFVFVGIQSQTRCWHWPTIKAAWWIYDTMWTIAVYELDQQTISSHETTVGTEFGMGSTAKKRFIVNRFDA